jgi:hypothetical protein
MANINIDIAAEFTGAKAFQKAETSTDKLQKNVKDLGKSLVAVFGVQQVLAFGKASVKAALDAQAQQERLANLVKVTVGASESQIRSLNEQAAALENIGVVNKENVTQTQSQLATFNFQIDTIKQLTPAILDYVTAEKGAAASTDEFRSMTNGLAQALNGNFASLTKSGFVLDDATKKIIKNGSESERTAAIVAVLDSTYKDFNKNLRMTDSGQMQILANAADDVKEIIGTGLINALKGVGDDNSVADLAKNMESFATEISNAIQGLGLLIAKFKEIPGGNFLFDRLAFAYSTSGISILSKFFAETQKNLSGINAQGLIHLAELESKYAKEVLNNSKKLTAEELKQLKAKQLKAAIDKANLALGKSENVFDIERIQLAAAEVNQAQQLGKVTSQAQLLQITNDLARLQVKQSILALEDAIKSNDVQAITNATAKLNADLRVLGALTGQQVKLTEIKDILAGILPKDLINLDNLNQAIALLGKINTTTPAAVSGTTGLTPAQVEDALANEPSSVATSLSASEISGMRYAAQGMAEMNRYLATVASSMGGVAGASFAQGTAAGLPVAQSLSGARYAAQGAAAAGVSVVNNFNGIVGDPNGVAEIVNQVLRDAIDRGTLRNLATE